MQLNNEYFNEWLKRRGITEEVIALFNISTYNHPTIGECIRIPFSPTHAKYRRDPRHDIKPKYLYDAGGKVTLYGFPHISAVTPTIVITEGELDALVLWSMNIPAVSSTGGAMSFQEEWVEQLKGHEVYLCFDNDDAGADGMVKVLKYIPDAKIIFIPETVGVKDISDFVSRGGDFRALMDSALSYASLAEVKQDMGKRKGQWLSVRFHERYIDENTPRLPHNTNGSVLTYDGDDEVLRAKTYPCGKFVEFSRNKACCPFHNEKTPSLQYYPRTNTCYCFGSCGKSYDVIDLYKLRHGGNFVDAVRELNKLV